MDKELLNKMGANVFGAIEDKETYERFAKLHYQSLINMGWDEDMAKGLVNFVMQGILKNQRDSVKTTTVRKKK